MGIFDWLRRKQTKSREYDTVPFYDLESGSVVKIPRCELASNAIQVQIRGVGGLVWVLPDKLKQGGIRHEPFGEDLRDYLRHIQAVFAEHRDLSLEEWEDGFRRDATPEREIALWTHAADILLHFTTNESCSEHRADVYRCIVTCMTTGPDAVWDIWRPQTLDHQESRRVINRFFGKGD